MGKRLDLPRRVEAAKLTAKELRTMFLATEDGRLALAVLEYFPAIHDPIARLASQ